MVGRRRIRKTAVASIVILVASCLVQRCRSVVDEQVVRTGTQTISQACAPKRRRRLVIVDDISLVCDYQASYEEEEGSNYNYQYYYQNDNQEGDSGDENQNNNQYQYQNNQNRNDGNAVYYTNSLTCRPGDTAKVAVGCTYRLCVLCILSLRILYREAHAFVVASVLNIGSLSQFEFEI
jgi:hypothetical protein